MQKHSKARRQTNDIIPARRTVLRASIALGMYALAPASLAAKDVPWRAATPGQPAGPFYLPIEPLSVDSDLARVAGSSAQAEGELLYVTGRVVDQKGRPIAGARVEIWHANNFGRYSHPRHRSRALKDDPNFQGFGHVLAGADGQYRFRTIKPGTFAASSDWMRPPHVHFAVFAPASEVVTTQMYFEGEPLNEADPLLNRLSDPVDRRMLVVPLQAPGPKMEGSAKHARFDIVLGSPAVLAQAGPSPLWTRAG